MHDEIDFFDKGVFVCVCVSLSKESFQKFPESLIDFVSAVLVGFYGVPGT
jgi:hypothetical protein